MVPVPAPRSPHRWTPRASYLVALGLVALLSSVAFLLSRTMIEAQSGTAAVINLSGRQRMLSQRTTLYALRLAGTPPGPARTPLRETLRADLRAMLDAHRTLLTQVRGSAAQHSDQAHTALQTVYFGMPSSLDALVGTHARQVQAVLDTPDAALNPDTPAVLALLSDAPGDLLDALDAAVRIHQADAETRLASLRRLEAGVLAATLLTLLLEGLLIFRPMERELDRRREQLVHDAFHDALTGLPNRALFMNRLEHALTRHARHPDARFAVLFLDCDRFKVINDSLGHAVGDGLLIALGARVKACVRGLDTVARLGGDEFTVLLEGLAAAEDAQIVAERIAQALTLPFEVDGHRLHVTASIGMITSGEGHASAAEVMRDADLAMYRAKALGRARLEAFTPALRERAAALMNLEQDLRGARERGELSVHYQPLVILPGGELRGFEALLRWTHPRHGPVSPAEFIPVAEDCGLIAELDRFVLRAACEQVRAWQVQFPAAPALTLSVNVSGRHLERPDLAAHVAQVLRDTDFPAPQLKLELTEGVLAVDAGHVRDALAAIKALGVQLHIDDFGTGFSNLAYLHRLPADAIKIDQSFVRNLLSGEEHVELVRTIIAMARSLNLTVVAEGVETAAHSQLLEELGCGLAQGYLYSRPLTPAGATAFLAVRELTPG